jgi:hypothetical protein
MIEPTPRYGHSARGVTQKDVSHAADELLRNGDRPTVERIRAKIGSGSPNTVGPLLDIWWKSLAVRLDAGPAAFHRLPESVLHIVEALWLQTLDEARARSGLEQSSDRRIVAQDKERTEVRSHVLALREAEMESRLKERDKTIAEMETRLQLLATALRREQAGRNELMRRLSAIESKPRSRPSPKAAAQKRSASKPKSKSTSPRRKSKKTRSKRKKGR